MRLIGKGDSWYFCLVAVVKDLVLIRLIKAVLLVIADL